MFAWTIGVDGGASVGEAGPLPRGLENPVVFIVSGDERDRRQLCSLLRANGFVPVTASDGLGALAAFDAHDPDLVLVDLLLSDISGLELCCRLRRCTSVPIVMITRAEEVTESEVGLDLGADHYVVWPRRRRELVARLRAVLRRANGHRTEVSPQHPIAIGDLQLDRAGFVAHIGDRPVQLAPQEFELLELIALARGRAVSRQFLAMRVWGADYDRSTRRLESNIQRLRAKLAAAHSTVRIVTARGEGFRFASGSSESIESREVEL